VPGCLEALEVTPDGLQGIFAGGKSIADLDWRSCTCAAELQNFEHGLLLFRVVCRSRDVPTRLNCPRLSAARSANAVYGQGGIAGFLSDLPVLFFDGGASGRIAVDAAQHGTGNSAIGPLGAVFVEDIEHHEFSAGRWLSGHFSTSRCTPAA